MDRKEVGKLIKIGLTRKDMTLADLAKIMKMKESSVGMWTSGSNMPPGDKLIKIINLLGLHEDFFPDLEIVSKKDIKREILNALEKRLKEQDKKIESLQELVEGFKKEAQRMRTIPISEKPNREEDVFARFDAKEKKKREQANTTNSERTDAKKV